MTVSKGGQCRTFKKGRTRGCTWGRGYVFVTGSIVKLAASAWNGEEGKCNQFSSFQGPAERQSFECIGDSELRRGVDQKVGHCSNQEGTGSVMPGYILSDAADKTELVITGLMALFMERVQVVQENSPLRRTEK